MLERFSRPRSFAHSEKRPLDGPIALLHIGLKRDVRHPAAVETAALGKTPSKPKAGIGRLSQTQAHMGMDRPGIEPALSHAGCDAARPTTPELRRPRVLKHLLAADFSAEALSRPARSACLRTPLVGARCGGQTSAASNSARTPAGHSFQR